MLTSRGFHAWTFAAVASSKARSFRTSATPATPSHKPQPTRRRRRTRCLGRLGDHRGAHGGTGCGVIASCGPQHPHHRRRGVRPWPMPSACSRPVPIRSQSTPRRSNDLPDPRSRRRIRPSVHRHLCRCCAHDRYRLGGDGARRSGSDIAISHPVASRIRATGCRRGAADQLGPRRHSRRLRPGAAEAGGRCGANPHHRLGRSGHRPSHGRSPPRRRQRRAGPSIFHERDLTPAQVKSTLNDIESR